MNGAAAGNYNAPYFSHIRQEVKVMICIRSRLGTSRTTMFFEFGTCVCTQNCLSSEVQHLRENAKAVIGLGQHTPPSPDVR